MRKSLSILSSYHRSSVSLDPKFSIGGGFGDKEGREARGSSGNRRYGIASSGMVVGTGRTFRSTGLYLSPNAVGVKS